MNAKILTMIPLLLCAGQGMAQEVTVPSGTDMTLFDVILEPEVSIARFRFLVPAIAGENGVSFADALPDIEYLCDDVVLRALAANGWTASEVVISLSASEVPFGVVTPDVVQYFQPFSIQAGACIWEEF